MLKTNTIMEGNCQAWLRGLVSSSCGTITVTSLCYFFTICGPKSYGSTAKLDHTEISVKVMVTLAMHACKASPI